MKSLSKKNIVWFTITNAEYFYIHDGLGTVRQILDDTQNVENQYDYEGFGTSLSSTENIYNRFRYTGREYDKETESDPTAGGGAGTNDGLYYYRARTYDSTIGSFTSRDPIPALNLYSYCTANPLTYTDPYGLKEDNCCLEKSSEELFELLQGYFNEIYNTTYNSFSDERIRSVLDKARTLLSDDSTANIALGAQVWYRYDTIEGIGRVKVHKFDYRNMGQFKHDGNNGDPQIRINLAPVYKKCLCNKDLSDSEKLECAKKYLATRLIHETGHWLDFENRKDKGRTREEKMNEEGGVRFDTATILYELFGDDIFDEDSVTYLATGLWFANLNQSLIGTNGDIAERR